MSLWARIQTSKDSSVSSKGKYKKKAAESLQVHTRAVKSRAGRFSESFLCYQILTATKKFSPL